MVLIISLIATNSNWHLSLIFNLIGAFTVKDVKWQEEASNFRQARGPYYGALRALIDAMKGFKKIT